MAKSKSPTARTLEELRKLGVSAGVVERWIDACKQRFDLFGCIDIIAMRNGKIVGIQATSGANHATRIAKAKNEPRLVEWLKCGGQFEVWSWKKQGAKGKRPVWTARVDCLNLSTDSQQLKNEEDLF